MTGKRWNGFLLALTGLLAIVPLFQQLDYLPIRLFDESRLVNSALEMSRNHDFLVVHYKGEPEMWSVKPPLMIWCQVACVKLFGAGEWAMRFPSAMSGLFTILLLYVFVRKITGSSIPAFAAAMVLIVAPGYIVEHSTRSGDYDSMLVMFQFASAVCYFVFLQNVDRRIYWYLTCLAVLLAVYTKGIAGFMHIPGLLLFTILRGKWSSLLKLKSTWMGIAGILVVALSYYGLREVYNPGYIAKVIDNEITYRYFDVNEGHAGPWNFYLVHLEQSGFKTWIWFAIAGMITCLWFGNERIRLLTLFAASNALLFLWVISASKTKIEWYAIPLYPWLSVLAGVFFFCVYEILDSRISNHLNILKFTPIILFTGLAVWGYVALLNRTARPSELENERSIYNLSYVFQNALRGHDHLDGRYYCYPPYNAHIHFYTELLRQKGQTVTWVEQDKILPGSNVLSGMPDVTGYITSAYECDTIRMYPGGVVELKVHAAANAE